MEWGDKDNAVFMNNLQALQNKAAKLVLDKPLYSSATDALNQLGWSAKFKTKEALPSLLVCL